MSIFGLIGKTLSHSFSEGYFNDKFHKEDINDAEYKNFELNNISEFTDLISKIKLSGLNVTTPYKESIIPFLDELTPHANAIGAVNTIQFKDNKLIGHNTDTIGFLQSIYPLLNKRNKALILGNGGASKAIQYVLKILNIEYKIVSRKSSFDYLDISSESIGYYDIIINTTPLGTHPKIAWDSCRICINGFSLSLYLAKTSFSNVFRYELLNKYGGWWWVMGDLYMCMSSASEQ